MQSQWRFPAALFLTLSMAVPAFADVINISAVTFVLRTENGSGDLVGEASNGELLNALGKFYAPVILPIAGRKICRFSLVYRDFDDNNITAKLLKKRYNIGGVASNPPRVLATLQSAGAVDAVRRETTSVISFPTVETARAFYFVELTLPFTALEVLGVEVVVQPTCP